MVHSAASTDMLNQSARTNTPGGQSVVYTRLSSEALGRAMYENSLVYPCWSNGRGELGKYAVITTSQQHHHRSRLLLHRLWMIVPGLWC